MQTSRGAYVPVAHEMRKISARNPYKSPCLPTSYYRIGTESTFLEPWIDKCGDLHLFRSTSKDPPLQEGAFRLQWQQLATKTSFGNKVESLRPTESVVQSPRDISVVSAGNGTAFGEAPSAVLGEICNI